MEETEDQRDDELSSLSAIFPEIARPNENDAYTFTLELPVNPSKAVTVFFEAASEGNGVDPTVSRNGPAEPHADNIDSHELSHLPPVFLQVSLPPTYPTDQPPLIAISTSPSWLPPATAKKLKDDCTRLWEELGRDLVVFTYIDHVQQSADDVFGLVTDSGALEISPEHKIAVLDHDIRAKQAAFEKGTFDCGVCLDPKKGTVCHRMLDCGHVFCRECLQDFYNNAITEGALASVRCLEPNCAKQRDTAQAAAGKKRQKPKTFISPSELLQIPLEKDMVKRYVTLKYKTQLESDKNTIYCPRTWCQGAARSKKHRKPEGFELQEAEEDSGSESEYEADEIADGESPKKKTPKPFKTEELLSVCEDCGFAFCSRCQQSWHGEFFHCTPTRDKKELSAEEMASLKFIELHTTPCPTCSCPAQKTMGCNHMICYKCQTHFCYLCSAWLDPSNPYVHYNTLPNGRIGGCYQRLWELEAGDEGDNEFLADFDGQRAAMAEEEDDEDEAEAAELANVIPEIEEAEGGDEHNEDAEEQMARPGNGGRVDVAREGPLVLRIAADPPPARQAPPAVPHPPQAGPQNRIRGNAGAHQPQQQAQRGRGHGRGRGRGRGAPRGGAHRNPQANQGPNHAPRLRERNVNPELQHQADEPGGLDAANQAWVRHFVHLALNDNEHLIEDDGGDDDEYI